MTHHAGAGPGSTTPIEELLDLEELDVDLYRGGQPDTDRQRVFGGQVAAQALVAATRTVGEEFAIHSLHSYFLLPGDYGVPMIYDVERIRDGRSFLTRRVVARQHGRAIYFLTASFHVDEPGLEHQDAMPDVPGPEEGQRWLDLIAQRGDRREAESLVREWGDVDARWLGSSSHGMPEDLDHPSRSRMWLRISHDLPDDPVVHTAAFTYASDISLLGASLAAHGVGPPAIQMASLDHTIWFHRPFRADEWWLYDQWSPSAQGARGLALGRVFTPDGRLVATVAQEGLVRPARKDR